MTHFKHQQFGRRPVMWVFLMVGLGFGGVMIQHPAPVSVWIIVVLYLALVSWSLVINPVYGIEITGNELVVDPDRQGRRIPLAEIAFLKIDTRSDNTDFDLHLHSAEIVSLTGARVPSTAKTKAVFEDRGVEVQLL